MRRVSFIPLVLLALAGSLALGGCGDLDNVTTVKDLRVLAIKTEPAGFLVDLNDPGAAQPEATLTALVVDPQAGGRELTFTAKACPDYIDTITSATGQASKICPAPDAAAVIPGPIGEALKTTEIPGGVAPPDMDVPVQYNPSFMYGFTPQQLGLFFTSQVTGIPQIDQATAYNRDFGLAAIVNLIVATGGAPTPAIKRVVYWPRLTANQQPNQNPQLGSIGLFKMRGDDGQPTEPWTEMIPTLSIALKNKLFVNPLPVDGAAEPYELKVRDSATDEITIRPVARELLTFQFYATAGSFSPPQRQSELDPFLTSPDGKVHTDSEYNLPAEKDLPADGKVTIWVVVRDERAGTWWDSRTITVTP